MGYYSNFTVLIPRDALTLNTVQIEKAKVKLAETIAEFKAADLSTDSLTKNLKELESEETVPECFEFDGYSLVLDETSQTLLRRPAPQPPKLFVQYLTPGEYIWHSFEEDMRAFSKRYIGWTIQAERIGEESPDFQLYRFRDGESESVAAKVTYPVENFSSKFVADFPMNAKETTLRAYLDKLAEIRYKSIHDHREPKRWNSDIDKPTK